MSNNYINPHMTTLADWEAYREAEKYNTDKNYPYMDEIYKILNSYSRVFYFVY